jgi:hypothetical protein
MTLEATVQYLISELHLNNVNKTITGYFNKLYSLSNGTILYDQDNEGYKRTYNVHLPSYFYAKLFMLECQIRLPGSDEWIHTTLGQAISHFFAAFCKKLVDPAFPIATEEETIFGDKVENYIVEAQAELEALQQAELNQ